MEDEELVEESLEREAADVSGEEEESEPLESDEEGGEVEYELGEDGEPLLDEDGEPVIKVVEAAEEKKDHKKNAADRIQQLIQQNKVNEDRLAKMEVALSAKEAEKPDFFDVDINQVNEYMQTSSDQIETLKLEGRFLEAKKIELAQVKLISDIEANDLKRKAYQERQGKAKSEYDGQAKVLAEVDRAAEFYRESMKIDPEIWTKQAAWFTDKCNADPLLGREFAERVETQSRIAAVKWAHDYTVQNMGLKEKAAIDKKNLNKQTASGAAPKSASGKASTSDAVSKALATAKETGDWAPWFEAKRQAKR